MAAKSKISKSGLETLIKDLSLLDEEKKMWMAIGFFVSTPNPSASSSYSSSSSSGAYMYVYDNAGNKAQLTDAVANNLRKVVIEWWESGPTAERPSPRETLKASLEPLDELEERRG